MASSPSGISCTITSGSASGTCTTSYAFGTSVTLTAPSGQCELDPGQPSDARMLQITESTLASVGNRLLGFYADCKQLNDWRTGKRALLEDFAQYQTSIAAIDAPAPAVPAEAIKQLCSQQREASEKVVTGIATDMKARIEEAVRGVQLNQVRSLGVVAEDANACYAALVQRFKAETGKDVTIMALFATTFVQGKLVLYYLYSPYRSAQTMTRPTMPCSRSARASPRSGASTAGSSVSPSRVFSTGA